MHNCDNNDVDHTVNLWFVKSENDVEMYNETYIIETARDKLISVLWRVRRWLVSYWVPVCIIPGRLFQTEFS